MLELITPEVGLVSIIFFAFLAQWLLYKFIAEPEQKSKQEKSTNKSDLLKYL